MMGDQIRRIRKINDMTLKELAAELGMGESTISLYENGKRFPDYSTLLRMSELFEVPCAYFLEEGLFSKVEWVGKNYGLISSKISDDLSSNLKGFIETFNDSDAIVKSVILSRFIKDIEVENVEDAVPDFRIIYYYDRESLSYDELFEIEMSYASAANKNNVAQFLRQDESDLLIAYNRLDNTLRPKVVAFIEGMIAASEISSTEERAQ